ncbi:MAG: winged helix-turn-helix transcriptional regulator [Gemmatimonadaceae bacterium]
MRPAATSLFYHPLEEILGSRAVVRVVRVLASHGGGLSNPDIARRARLSLPSVRTALRRLIAADVVVTSGSGRATLFTLEGQHPLTPALRELYAMERRSADTFLDEIRKATARLDPTPLAAWLFGSVSRTADESGSDIDIALLSSKGKVSSQAEMLREGIIASIPFMADRISIVGFGPNDIKRMIADRSAFWRRLERDAVVLTGDDPISVRKRFTSSRAKAM